MTQIFIFASSETKSEYQEKIRLDGYQSKFFTKFEKNELKNIAAPQDVIFLTDSLFKDFNSLAYAVKFIAQNYPRNRLFLLNKHTDIKDIFELLKLGLLDFINTSFSNKRILELISKTDHIFAQHATQEINHLIFTELGLVGNSKKFRKFIADINNAYLSSLPIIISGELGSEKFRIAHFLHSHSAFMRGKLIRENCQNLIDADLDLDEALQTIVNKSISGTLIIEEVNLFAAKTHKFIAQTLEIFAKYNLADKLQLIFTYSTSPNEKNFVNRHPKELSHIHISELRELKSDLPDLIFNRLKKLSDQQLTEQIDITDAALTALQNYDFPGNFFEFNNLIDSLFIQVMNSSNNKITLEQIPKNLAQNNPMEHEAKFDFVVMSSDLKSARMLFEKEYLVSQIKRFSGNISQTAAFIGMERTALHRKLISLGIDSDFLRKSLK